MYTVADEPAPAPPLLRGVRAAFVSFSRLPLGGYPYRAEEWRWAPAHLPLVGMAIGAGSAAVWLGTSWLGLPRNLAAALALGASVWATGALHEDGLADSADALGGGRDRERVLAILKDSRIGTYGALALGFSLLIRAGAIATLNGRGWFALVAVHCLARLGPVRLMLSEPYVTDPALAKSPSFLPIARAQLLVASGWVLLALTGGVLYGTFSALCGALMVLAAALLVLLAARYYRRAVGGITGDLLGALEQAAEMLLWLVWICCHDL
jgi:adenosylcobinamide-GDP ribazoletransferase